MVGRIHVKGSKPALKPKLADLINLHFKYLLLNDNQYKIEKHVNQ